MERATFTEAQVDLARYTLDSLGTDSYSGVLSDSWKQLTAEVNECLHLDTVDWDIHSELAITAFADLANFQYQPDPAVPTLDLTNPYAHDHLMTIHEGSARINVNNYTLPVDEQRYGQGSNSHRQERDRSERQRVLEPDVEVPSMEVYLDFGDDENGDQDKQEDVTSAKDLWVEDSVLISYIPTERGPRLSFMEACHAVELEENEDHITGASDNDENALEGVDDGNRPRKEVDTAISYSDDDESKIADNSFHDETDDGNSSDVGQEAGHPAYRFHDGNSSKEGEDGGKNLNRFQREGDDEQKSRAQPIDDSRTIEGNDEGFSIAGETQGIDLVLQSSTHTQLAESGLGDSNHDQPEEDEDDDGDIIVPLGWAVLFGSNNPSLSLHPNE